MQALLVGGPLHGKVVPLEDKSALRVLSESAAGKEYSYTRRSTYAHGDSEIAIFVHGEANHEQVNDAVGRSDLMSNTGNIRTLGPDFAPWLADHALKEE